MKIGLSYDLKEDLVAGAGLPEDAFEEYDSLDTVDALDGALRAQGHEIVRLGGGRGFLERVLSADVDFVFNIAEGRGNYRAREAQVPAVLEMLGIPYSGSDPLTMAVTLEKPLTKELVAGAGITTPRWRLIGNLADMDRWDWADFPFPVFAKPAHEGSSKGICAASRVTNPTALRSIVQAQLASYAQPIMVEEFIAGDEVTVGMVGNDPPQVVGVMRVVPRNPQEDFVYSLEVKRHWRELVRYECPALLPKEILRRLNEACLGIYKVLGVRDLARLDFRIASNGTPYFLEINPLPGLNPQSGDIVLMSGMMGMSYYQLIATILNAAMRRYNDVP
jgi:D-alanine-D-alanine ligase